MNKRWLSDLVDILKDANISVIGERYTTGQYAGKRWDQVAWKNMPYTPELQFIMWHHDASPEGPSEGALSWIKTMDIGPAGGAWVCMGCNGKHSSGTWHITAAGAHNHAGSGGPWSANNGAPYVSRNAMNYRSLGVEVDHTWGESWQGAVKQQQLNSLRAGTAAIMKAYDLDPKTRLIRHLDWTNGLIDGVPKLQTFGRKNDIFGVDLDYERRLVGKLIEQSEVDPRRIARIKRRIRGLRRRRDKIRASGRTKGIPTIRRKIRELNQRLKNITGK